MNTSKNPENLATLYSAIRSRTEQICEPLATEDYVVQSMADVSPAKWHLAHVTWFFETFLLIPYLKNYSLFNPQYAYLFNSYYESLGRFHPRTQRGMLSRPTVEEIYHYRKHVDQHMQLLIQSMANEDIRFALILGLNHEQQHQELILMDIKYNFYCNPIRPAYSNPQTIASTSQSKPLQWIEHAGGLCQIGHDGNDFAYDNEQPKHMVYLVPFKISNRTVTNAEYLEFILAKGYENPRYWLADGWQHVLQEKWKAPLYWELKNDEWWTMTLSGMQKISWQEPVCHISYYEADAYARWAHARLPTEAEWETLAQANKLQGNFLESGLLHPQAVLAAESSKFFGDVWEWTQSAYTPYPGYVPFKDAFSEYNGKFACNQFVLRGGSAITPESHMRLTYRNFFYPHQRWPFTGIRLAQNLEEIT